MAKGGNMNINEINEIANNEYLIKNIYDNFIKLNNAPNCNHYESDIKPLIKELNEAINLILLNIGVPRKYIKMVYLNFYENTNNRNIKMNFQNQKTEIKNNNVCAFCGSNENLTIHHTKPSKTNPHLRYNYNNMVVLCHECHRKHHTNILNISELMKGNNIKYGGIIWNENNQSIK